MRKLLILTMLAALVLPGCKKEEKTVTFPEENKPVVDSNAMQYVITGLTDVSLGWKDEKILPLGFAYTKGNQEPISLSVSGLPDGVTAEFDVAKGTPSFASMLKLKSDVMKDGNYALQVVCKTDKDSTKKFNFNLKVQTGDCRDYATGKWTYTSACIPHTLTVNIEKGDVSAWTVILNSLVVNDGNGVKGIEPLPFKVNCDSKTLELPYWSYRSAPAGDYHLMSGNGNYNAQTMNIVINFHDRNTGEIYRTCEYQFSR